MGMGCGLQSASPQPIAARTAASLNDEWHSLAVTQRARSRTKSASLGHEKCGRRAGKPLHRERTGSDERAVTGVRAPRPAAVYEERERHELGEPARSRRVVHQNKSRYPDGKFLHKHVHKHGVRFRANRRCHHGRAGQLEKDR